MTVIGCGSALQRLAFLMMSLYRRQQHHPGVEAGHCPFPLRRQHLADALGLTGAHVNRTLNRLREDAIGVVDGRFLSILDLPRLCEIGGLADSSG